MQITDREIVDGILRNDSQIIYHFFFVQCAPMFAYIVRSVFDNRADGRELVSELYLYLSDDNWYKVRQFDFRSRLTTWLSVVAIRFFQKKRDSLIENESQEPPIHKERGYLTSSSIDRRIDIRNALKKMNNSRYRKVIEELELKERPVEEVAAEMQITEANLYNLRRRARMQLAMIMDRKEDYYD